MSETATLSAGVDARTRTLRNYVAGRWRYSASDEYLEDRDPATGELLARIPLSNAEDVDLVVLAASEAAGRWGAESPLVRMRAVFRLREVLSAHRDELAALVTRDMGKTLANALGEVVRVLHAHEGGYVDVVGRQRLPSVST